MKVLEKKKVEIPQWYAVHTKYKCEKHVVNALQKKAIDAYTPVLQVTKEYTRKIVKRDLPLINCYAFVKVTSDQFAKVLQTEYVFSFLKIGKEMIAVKQDEIDLLKRITGEYNEVKAEEIEYKEGVEVEIIAGNLTGVKGILLEKKSKHNFLVELRSLSYQLKINVDPDHLRLIRKVSVAI